MSKKIEKLQDLEMVRIYFNKKEGEVLKLTDHQNELINRIVTAEQFLSKHYMVSRTVNALNNYYKKQGRKISLRQIREDINDAKHIFGNIFNFNKEYERYSLIERQKSLLAYSEGPLYLGDLPDNVKKKNEPDMKSANAAIANLIKLGGFDRAEQEKINPDDIKPPVIILTTDPAVLGIKGEDSREEQKALFERLQKRYNIVADDDAQILK